MRFSIAGMCIAALALGGAAAADCGDGEIHPDAAVTESAHEETEHVSYEPTPEPTSSAPVTVHEASVDREPARVQVTSQDAGPRQPSAPTKANPDLGVESAPSDNGSILNGRTRID